MFRYAVVNLRKKLCVTKKPIEPKTDVVTVAKFSETVDDDSVGMPLVLVLLEALLITVEASV